MHISVEPPLLVFGGPYSNLRALTALRDRADALGIPARNVVCTGDVVAYCAEPEETTRAIRDWGCHVVAGNCEEQLAQAAEDCACGFEAGSACDTLAKGWYPFANGRMSAESRAWMAGLPRTVTFTIAGVRFRVIHGGVDNISRFIFNSQHEVIAEELARAAADVVIAGHCGLPFIRHVRGQTWFNPGVIGMPANDGTQDVWYGIIRRGQDAIMLSTHRLTYDAHGAAAAMRRTGHADGYARTLISGLWPSLDILPPEERAGAGERLRLRTLHIPADPRPRSSLGQRRSIAP